MTIARMYRRLTISNLSKSDSDTTVDSDAAVARGAGLGGAGPLRAAAAVLDRCDKHGRIVTTEHTFLMYHMVTNLKSENSS